METETRGGGMDKTMLPNAEELETFEERMQAGVDVARARLATLNERTTAMMRAHPGATILVALGMGYLIGRLASRR